MWNSCSEGMWFEGLRLQFIPTDEELVTYYLRRKVEGLESDDDVIQDVDVYSVEPWLLPHKHNPNFNPGEWYYFVKLVEASKNGNGKRPRRTVEGGLSGGYWRTSVGRKEILSETGLIVGYKSTLNFYLNKKHTTNSKEGVKTDWIMTEYSFSRDSFQQQVLCKIRKQDNAKNTSHVPYLLPASDMCAYDRAPPDQSAKCLRIEYGAVETKVGGTTLYEEEIRQVDPLYTFKANDGVDVFLTYDGDEYYDIPRSDTPLMPLTDYQHWGASAVGGFTARFTAPSDEAVDSYAEELRRLMGCNEEGGGLLADAGCEGLTAATNDDKDDCYAKELEELLLGDGKEPGRDGSVETASSDKEDGCYPEQLERLLLAVADDDEILHFY